MCHDKSALVFLNKVCVGIVGFVLGFHIRLPRIVFITFVHFFAYNHWERIIPHPSPDSKNRLLSVLPLARCPSQRVACWKVLGLGVCEMKDVKRDLVTWDVCLSRRIHVWYIYLHLVDFYGKCRYIYHTWILWVWKHRVSKGRWVVQIKYHVGFWLQHIYPKPFVPTLQRYCCLTLV